MINAQRRSERDRTLDRSFIIGFLLGAGLGIAIFVFVIFFRPWQQVVAPPEKAVELLAYYNNAFEDNTLYVRTVSGNLYTYGPSSHSADDIKWRRVAQVNQEASGNECDFGKFSTPRPPGRILSQLESHPCVLDGESQVNYIILEDGSIWKWEEATGELDLLLIPMGAVVAFISGSLGAVAGLLIGFATWKLRQKRSEAD